MDSPDYWEFHRKTLNSARRCYKFNQSQSFLNIFECCLKGDPSATKVEYIAEELIPYVFNEYENLCDILFKGWEKLKCSDASVLWKGVKNVNAEIKLMTGSTCTRDERFIKSLDNLSKIPQRIEKLEQLNTVVHIFNVEDDCLSMSIRNLKDDSKELGQLNDFFKSQDQKLSIINEDCWKLITELSSADNFMEFLKKIADHDITNLINGLDDHSDEQLIQGDTVSSLIQVKQFFVPLINDGELNTVDDVLIGLKSAVNKNPTLSQKIAFCNDNNKALQNMYENISNRGEITKEKIKNAVTNGTYTFKREGKGDKCLVTLEYTSNKTNNKIQYGLNDILDLRGRALLIAKPKTTVRTNEDFTVDDDDIEMPKIIDDFVTQVDIAQEIFNVISVLIEVGHFDYRTFEENLHGTRDMEKYLDRW